VNRKKLNLIQRFPAGLSKFVVSKPWLTVILCVVFVVLCGRGALFLEISKDIRIFFSPDNPQLKTCNDLEQTYAKSNSVLLVLSRKDNGTIFTADSLTAIQYITERAWKTPFSRRVDSLTNYQHSFAEDDDLIVEDLVASNATELTEESLERIRKNALSNVLLVDRLVSRDGTVAAVNVPIQLEGKDQKTEQPAVAEFVRSLKMEVEEKFPGMRVYLTGIVMINQALDDAIQKDGSTLVPLMFALIILCLAFLLRSFASALAAFLVIVFSIVVGFGLAGWLGITFSPTVLSAVNMIMTLAVADSVHVLTGFRNRVNNGTQKKKAMMESLDMNFRPVFLTSATTILGFLSLNSSDSPPFRDLGNVVAIGVFSAWLFVYTLLPALILILPTWLVRTGKRDAGHESPRWLMALAELVIRKRVAFLLFGAIVTFGMSGLILKNELNDEFVKYFDEEMEFRVATDFTIERLTGFEYIDYSLSAEEEGGISEPEYLHKVDAFAEWYRQQPKVRHVFAYTDLVKRLNMNLHADKPEYFTIPETRAVAADCLMMYEMSLPFGLDLADQINLDKSATLFKVSIGNITSNELVDLDKQAQIWLKDNGLSPESTGTGQSMMFAYIGPRNIKSMLFGTVGALLLISMCMIVITRSFKFGIVSMFPNLAPAVLGFAVWGLTVGQVGLAISVVVGMTLGIVVDDSIHFITKYLSFRRDDELSPADSIRKTFQHVAGAMLTTTITLVIGFGVLAFSTFELNSGMGLLSAIVITLALIFDLTVLPAILLSIDQDPDSASRTGE
jgi:hypothetical protein